MAKRGANIQAKIEPKTGAEIEPKQEPKTEVKTQAKKRIMDEPSPMVAQILALKKSHPTHLLFYRMGDFYELFFDDALEAAQILDIALTHRGQYEGKAVPMCGVPYYEADTYVHRLIRAGRKVAICEQMEEEEIGAEEKIDEKIEPDKKRPRKSILRREVTRIVTAGTLTEDSLLKAGEHNFLAALGFVQDKKGRQGQALALAWLDMSTGDVALISVPDDERAGLAFLLAQLASLAPREILLPKNIDATLTDAIKQAGAFMVTMIEPAHATARTGKSVIGEIYQGRLVDGFGQWTKAQFAACGALFSYITHTQKTALPQFKPPRLLPVSGLMRLDAPTRKNLELTRTLAGTKSGSLLHAIDMTVTAAGSRLLATRLATPLTDRALIETRQQAIAVFHQNNDMRGAVRRVLVSAPDSARALMRLAMKRGSPRDLLNLQQGFEAALAVKIILQKYEPDLGAELHTAYQSFLSQDISEFHAHLKTALLPEPPALARDGGFIAAGFDVALDEARRERDEASRHIARLQNEYIKTTKIKSLKIKHNATLGYYIDVPLARAETLSAPPFNDLFIHRQTLASHIRFTTSDLNELAAHYGRAKARSVALELALFNRLTARAVALASVIAACAEALALCDVASALAELAITRNWVCPELFDDTRFIIQKARHPVVEQALHKRGNKTFIANDCVLNHNSHLLLLTGPNMAGKSTYLRQNAHCAILAHMGSYVPAARAEIGMIDQLFSRVGAGDDLAQGRSTFMVEMVETAAILNQASAKSFIIVDEIGRGTATYDGLSIAMAAVEHIHNVIKARTLCATHYHELTALADELKGLKNMTMAVRLCKEGDKNEMQFLHKIIDGVAERSYGIYVAEMAGLPSSVITRAEAVLNRLVQEQKNNELKK